MDAWMDRVAAGNGTKINIVVADNGFDKIGVDTTLLLRSIERAEPYIVLKLLAVLIEELMKTEG